VYHLANHELVSPVVAAAGFQNGTDPTVIIEKFNDLLKTNVGAITLGSFTIPPNDGNEPKYGPPVYYYDASDGKTYNSMGLANIGMEAAVKLADYAVPEAHRLGKIVIINGSPLGSDDYGSSVEQALTLAKNLLKTKADLIELNLSCPNIVTSGGGRKPIMGYDLNSVIELLAGLSKIKEVKRIGLKMPPYISAEEKKLVPKLAKLIKRYRIGFITVSNTIPNQIAKNYYGEPVLSVPGGAGGLSGPATKKAGREQLKLWRRYLGNSTDIISLLGVDSLDEVNTRLKMGAAAGGGATFFRERLPLLKEINSTGQVSQKVILAIDTSDKNEAEKMVKLAAESSAQYVKFGLELSSAAGWKSCSRLAKRYNLAWVADAKLDDIPNTVEKTVLNLKNLPYPPFGITMHVTAGAEAMRLAQAAAADIMILGVTVLTSIPDKEAKAIYGASSQKKVLELAEYAAKSGLKGIVASPREVGRIKQNPKTKQLFAMIPGVRSASASQADQSRVGTPAGTLKAGADLLVIGRQVTQTDSPAEAYNQLLREIEGASRE
jgi:orotidine-5'-phosphate decarboxylase